ncbi:Kef-type K+ transport system, membrane component KefB [Natronorubrum sediminis]|uniref:Kef-type K+ transport system, membrane component KefB n=1 Tax=Natronorubrum sediminis TaxID=640943 RepID=A0A1H6FSK1_9EURY|nr:cation:proton antiporter [Natronorubrum sediminis]SEH13352.1 Kef-type K+ transport system, membrane component KefB [Natronorubrum sediminis]
MLEDLSLPALPFQDPIIIFAIAMVVFLVAPLVFERYRLPGIIGIIVVGTAIGPNGFGFLDRSETFVLLGEVGLVYLMFLAGLEIDLGEFVANRDRSLVFGALSFLLPQGLGMAVGVWFLGFDVMTAALYAAIFSSHTLLAYPIVNKLGIVKNEAVTAAIGGTIFTDTAALLVLAIVAGAAVGDLTIGFWVTLVVGLVALFAGIWLLVPRLGRWFFRNVSEESYFEFLFVMAVLFVCAAFAELAGVKHIIGAFLAGLALNRLIPTTSTLMNRIEFVGNALLIPFFLISVGMLVDPVVVVGSTETLVIAGTIIVLLLFSKLFASWVTGAIYDYTTDERMAMFGLSSGQAAAALAITLIGYEDLGLFEEPMVNGVVLMILVVSFLSPALSKRYGRQIVDAEADSEYDPGDQPTRVLVPLAGNRDTMEPLLDFGMLVRETAGNAEPLRALTVVNRRPTRLRASRTDQREQAETATAVADAEETLEHAAEHVAGAEVPVETHTRVETSVADGISKTVLDERITTTVLGWASSRRFGSRFFGDIVEQTLEQTTVQVLVSRLREPLNVTERVVCVLPAHIASHPGFYETIHTVKTVADELGVDLECYVIGGNPERYEQLVDAIEPETTTTVDVVPVGDGFDDAMDDRIDENDFVVALSPRPGSRGWETRLQSLPRRLTALDAENVVVAYPSEEDTSDKRRFLDMG